MVKALGKGSIASLIKVGLHVLGVILWISMAFLLLAAIGYGVALGLVVAGIIHINLPGHDAWEFLVWPIVLPAFLIGALFIGGGILIVRRLRLLFQSLTSGEPFKKENADHLRVIWITMLVVEISRYVFGAVVMALIAGFGLPEDLSTDFTLDSFQLAPWISILIIIVLAEVFREGARLREEQELTI